MQTPTHVSWSHRTRIALIALVVGILMIPSGLGSMPAAAVGTIPGPIPSVALVSRGANTVTMSWTAPWTDGGSPITDYRIDIKGRDGVWQTVEDGVSTGFTSAVPGLVTGESYEIRVAARNANGDGPATVYGAASRLLVTSDQVCSDTPTDGLWCYTDSVTRAAVTYFDYPFLDAEHRHTVNDVIDMEGGCVLSRTAGVLCTGVWSNRYAEMGQGLTGGPVARFRVATLPDGITDISSTSQRVCAIDSSRNLWCWGQWSGSSDLILTPTVVKSGVKQFEGDCARFWDDTIQCLDNNGAWQSIPYFPTISKLSTGTHYNTPCGISGTGEVLCWNATAKSWLAQPGWTGAVDVKSGSARCVLMPTGTVKCYGANNSGELGDGTRVSSYATVRMPEPAIAISSNIALGAEQGAYAKSFGVFACAVGVSGAIYCWGNTSVVLSTGMKASTVPLTIKARGAEKVQSLSAPALVDGLRHVTRSASSVTVQWNPSPNTGALPVDGYELQWSDNNGSNWNTENLSRDVTSWTSNGLPANSTILVTVAARNIAGTGPRTPALAASTTAPPGRPLDLHELSHTANSATIEWYPSSDEDEPITGYRIERSYNGVDWTSETVGRDSWRTTLVNLVSRSAVQVRVKALNAAGESAYTDQVVVTTSGTGPQTVTVLDNYGTPVIGGRITWVTPTGSFQSAIDYGLTVSGGVTFPIAPAGKVNLTLTNVLLPGGATANFEKSTVFGQGRNPVVTLPAEPSRATHVVRVTLPDGSPVMGATVQVNGLSDTAVVDGTTFTTPAVVSAGVTNEFGEVYLVGYSTNYTSVAIEYNDGVLIQRLNGNLGLNDASFTFEEMPWVDPQIDTTTVSVGALVTIPVRSAVPNATVVAAAPAGAAQTCAGRVLSARTNANGQATLKVCATATGTYKVTAKGAVSTGAVKVYATGTKSLAVRSLKAVSRTHTTANLSWAAPAFTGGNAIVSYTVKMTSPTGAVITKTVTATTAAFTGLAGAKTYSVTVIPNTRLGAGAATVVKVPIA
ncbi:MAG: fibronectin type III domain-containing protein [Microbacteriaceae bacterium]